MKQEDGRSSRLSQITLSVLGHGEELGSVLKDRIRIYSLRLLWLLVETGL